MEIANQLDVKHLATFTSSGDSARRLSRLRPHQMVYAFTHVEHTHNILCLSWGVAPWMVPFADSTDKMTAQVDQGLLQAGIAQVNDLVVIAAGSPPGQAGSTNTLKVHRIGDLTDGRELLQAYERPYYEPVGPWPARSAY